MLSTSSTISHEELLKGFQLHIRPNYCSYKHGNNKNLQLKPTLTNETVGQAFWIIDADFCFDWSWLPWSPIRNKASFGVRLFSLRRFDHHFPHHRVTAKANDRTLPDLRWLRKYNCLMETRRSLFLAVMCLQEIILILLCWPIIWAENSLVHDGKWT